MYKYRNGFSIVKRLASNSIASFSPKVYARAFVLILTMLVSIVSFGSHYRYGNVKWTRTNDTSRTVTFTVTTAWRTSAFGTVTLNGPISPGIVLNFGDATSATLAPTVTSINTTDDWFVCTGTLTHTYTGTATAFTASYSSSARLSNLQNNANGAFSNQTSVNLVAGNTGSPVATMPAIINLPVGQTAASFNVPATDPDNQTLTYSLATSAQTSATNPAGLAINSSTGVATYNTSANTVGQLWTGCFLITDTKGSTTIVDFIMQMVASNTPPIFDYLVTPANNTVYNINPNQNVNFAVSASDVDPGSTVTLTAVGQPTGVSFSPSLPVTANPVSSNFSFTPTSSQLGIYIITFIATRNGGIQTNTTVTINVNVNPQFVSPPTKLQSTNYVILSNVLHKDTITANNPDPTVNTQIFSATIPSGASMSPTLPTSFSTTPSTVMSWTPTPANFGPNNVSFTAKDANNKTVTRNYTLEVNTVPTFTSSPVLTANACQPYTYNIVATDPDIAFGDDIDIVDDNSTIPSWLTLNVTGNGTAVLSGTPTTANVGSYTITIGAEDMYHHVTGLPEQTFTITVTDNSTTPTIAASGPTTFCQGGSVKLTASSGASYLWSTGAITQSINVATGGSYTVTVTPAVGCTTTSAPTVVTVNPLPTSTITAGGPTTFCQGGSVMLSASSGSSYLWNTAATTQSITASASGSYSVTVTNANNCSATSAATTVAVNLNPTIFNVTGGGGYCFGGTGVPVFLSGSQTGVNYQLQLNGVNTGSPMAGTNSSLNFGLKTAGGTYTVVATNAMTNCTITMSGNAVVAAPAAALSFTATPVNPNCAVGNSGSITVNSVSGGVSPYMYNLNGGSYQASGTFSSLSPSNYQLTVKDAANCTVSQVFGIVKPFCSVAVNDSFKNCQPNPINITLAQLIGNDTIAPGDTVTIGDWGTPTSGSVTYNSSTKTFTYTPQAGFNGFASFTYTIKKNDNTLAFSGNGHFYEAILGNITWTNARIAASNKYYNGMQGYLVTVTSAAENLFCQQKINSNSWIGASDLANEGVWRWVTGPEGMENGGLGRYFSDQHKIASGNCSANTGTAVGGYYNSWQANEPNDCGANVPSGYSPTDPNRPGEHVAHFYATGTWNDFPDNAGVDGYVVEYGGMETIAPVTTTSTATIYINNILVNTYSITGGGTTCAGGAGLPVGLNGSQTGINYQLKLNGNNTGAPVAGTGSSLSFGNQTVSGTYTVFASSAIGGCSATMSGSAVLVLNTIPSFTSCPLDNTVDAVTGTCNKVVSYIASATGIPVATITYAFTGATTGSGSGTGSGAVFNVGSTNVTITATNTCGSATCTFKITVKDVEAPVIICPGNITQTVLSGQCTAAVNYTTPTATDNCTLINTSGSQTFNYTGSIQNFTIPANVTSVTITTKGAKGGGTYGGLGASISGLVSVNSGQTLKILVGGQGNGSIGGSCPGNCNYGFSGGGGTFVTKSDNTPVMIAGGGGGSGEQGIASESGQGGLVGLSGGSLGYQGEQGGTAGNGGDGGNNGDGNGCGYPGSGGSGLLTNGGGFGAGGGRAFVNGGAGGVDYTENCVTSALGGFGGGGAGGNGGGGGGGYSGGAGGTNLYQNPNGFSPGGGGGSYNGGANQVNIANNNSGNGQVTISWNIGSIAQTQGLPSGGSFPIGTTNNTYTATDASGNQSSCSFTVTVLAPEADVTGNGNSIADGDNTPSATDNTDFGGSNPGVGVTKSYTIQNTGTSDLTVSSINISGADASSFSFSGITLPMTIAANGSTTFNVTFNTGLPLGFKNAVVTVNNNDCNEGAYDFAVRGEITCAPASFTSCASNININAVSGTCSATATYAVVANGTPSPSLTYTFSGATTGNGNGTGSGSTFNVGATTVTITATNPCSNPICSFTVTVNDNQNPIITAPATVSVNADNGSCAATGVVLGNPITADNCGVQSVTNNGLSSYPVGSTTVTWTVTDIHGNTKTATQTVTVTDNQNPTITAPATVTVNADNGSCAATNVALGNATTADNCGVQGVTNNAPASYPVGNTTVTWTVTDIHGNSSTATQTVTVNDNQPAIVHTQNITRNLDGTTGSVSITAAEVNNGSTDNCGIQSMSVSPNSFSCANVGPNTVTLTVTDIHGNVSTGTAIVTIVDNTAPIAHCQDLTVYLNPDPITVTPAEINNGSTDVCGIQSVLFQAIGTNNLTTNSSFTSGTTGWTIANVDFTGGWRPTGGNPGGYFILNSNGAVATDPSIQQTVTGLVAGQPYRINGYYRNQTGCCGANTAIGNPALGIDINGSQVIALPNFGNFGWLPFSIPFTASGSSATIRFRAEINGSDIDMAIDEVTVNYGGSVTATGITYDCSNIGITNNVVLVVKDVNGNQSTCTSTVTVLDTIKPYVITHDLAVELDASGHVSILPGDVDEYSNDACGIDSMYVTPNSFDCSKTGDNTVILTVIDHNHNTSSATAVVTVSDHINPSITCPANIVVSNDATHCNAVVNFAATATDNCSAAITYSQNPGTAFPVGTTTVTATATDPSGNNVNCSFTVTVNDNEKPTITAPATVTVNANSGLCEATNVALGNPVTGDNCGVQNVTNDAPASYPVGNTTVTWTVTDIHGNTNTATQTVTVVDNQAPNAVCQNVTLQLDNSGNATVTPDQVNNNSTDNCSIASVLFQNNVAATNLITNGSFTSGTSSWNSAHIDGSGGWRNPGGNPGGFFILNDGGSVSSDPTISQTISGLVSGQQYAIKGYYRNYYGCCGAFVGQTTFGVDINGSQIAALQNPGTNWTPFTVNFTAAASTATVGFRGEINGTDADMAIDEISVTANAPATVASISYNCSNIGNNPVVLVVKDIHGNSSTCNANVTVVDNIAPTIACPSNIIVNATSGVCNAIVTYNTPTATDNTSCVTITRIAGLASGSAFPVGETTVTYRATDGSGNSVVCSFTVTVNDNQTPIITCPASITHTADAGQCGYTVNIGTATATDNCAVATVAAVRSDALALDAPYPVGTTTVSWTATDIHGNTSNCTQPITVTDDENPVITCPASITHTADAGQCGYTVNIGTATATDNCAVESIAGVRSDAAQLDAPYPVGTTTVSWTATDIHGNTSNCTQTITVTDDENPVITCPASITHTADAGLCSYTVNIGDATATDNCAVQGIAGVRDDNASLNDPYLVGTTTVTWTVTDIHGNTSNCTQTITITDDENPVITCPANITHTADAGQCGYTVNVGGAQAASAPAAPAAPAQPAAAPAAPAQPVAAPAAPAAAQPAAGPASVPSSPAATATDNCAVATIVGVRSDNLALDAQYPVGVTTVTWTATDIHGNTSNCTQTITITDDENPVIACPESITHTADAGVCSYTVNIGAATATDNCAVPAPTGVRDDNAQIDAPYPVGTTTVTWTATDIHGNSSTCTQTITVTDDENPVITCPASITHTADAGACSYTVNIGTATATDNCAVQGMAGVRDDNAQLDAPYPVGTTAVTWTATDIHGNSSTCTQIIIVTDDEHPVITCPASITHTADAGVCSYAVNIGAATATDNCAVQGIGGVRSDAAALNAVYPVGTTTVTWTATDIHGNTSGCTQTITVTDDENPMISCPASITHTADAGVCSYAVNIGAATATDNCAVATIVGVRSDAAALNAVYPVGTTTVTWTATDIHGNTSSCTQTITVTDDENPIAKCKPYVLNLNNGVGSVTAANVDNNSTDNCGIATRTVTPNSFTCANAGPNTVTLTITDIHGNVSSCQTTVTVQYQPTASITVTPSNTIYTGGNPAIIYLGYGPQSATLTDNPAGGSGFTYSWTPSTYLGCTNCQNPVFTPTAAGTYTYTVKATNSNGCSVNATQTMYVSDIRSGNNKVYVCHRTLSCNMNHSHNNNCYNTNTLSVSVNAVAAHLAHGDYLGQCLDIDGTETDILCNGNNTGAINAVVIGGVAPYSYSWSNGATTEDISGLTAGNYTLTVNSIDGRITSHTFTVSQPSKLVVTGSTDDIHCYGGTDGEIDLHVSGGNDPYHYMWNDNNTHSDRDHLAAGSYSVTVTDDNGCTAKDTFAITQPASGITVTGVVTNVGCNDGEDGGVDVSVSGGTGPYVYSWGNGGCGNHGSYHSCSSWWSNWCGNHNNNNNSSNHSQDISGVEAGTYTVTVTDARGCSKTVSFVITEPTELNVSGSVTNIGCNGGSTGAITIAATGGTAPYSYKWNNNSTTQNRTGLTAGSYSVTVTDAHGCTKTVNYTVSQPAILATTIAVSNISCNGNNNGSINLGVTGGTSPYSYSWSNSATTQDLNNLGSGSYSVTVTDAKGCTAGNSATITQPAAIIVSGIAAAVSCNGDDDGGITLNVSGGTAPYSYSWSGGNYSGHSYHNCGSWWSNWCWNHYYNSSCSNHSQNLSNVEAGTYSVTVTDANGCSKTASFTVSEPTQLTIAGTVTNIGCNGGSTGAITIAAAGGTAPYSYKWNNNSTAQNRTGLAAGSYSVTVTDAHGCSNSASYTVSQPAAMSATATASNVSCNGSVNGAVSLSVSGGNTPYSYSWSNGATTQNITGLTAGSYSVTVTDARGCSTSKTAAVSQPATLAISSVVHNVSCNSDDDGAIDLNISGGTAPYSYKWNNNSTGQDRNNLTAGSYNVTVTDAHGCTATASFVITQPAAIAVSGAVTNVSCNGNNNGAITITATGGTNPYSYKWNNNSTAQNRTGLTTGNYSVTVTDGNGCSKTVSFTITQPTLITANVTVNPSPVVSGQVANTIFKGYGAQSVTLTGSASGGSAGYSYSWWPTTGLSSATTAVTTATPPATTTYTLTVTDANGCMRSVQVTIYVTDVRNGDLIKLCHNGNTLSVAQSAVAAHLAHGDDLGACGSNSGHKGVTEMTIAEMKVYPNPSTGVFMVELPDEVKGGEAVIMDMDGKLIERKAFLPDSKLSFDLGYVAKGIYMVEVKNGENVYRAKVTIN